MAVFGFRCVAEVVRWDGGGDPHLLEAVLTVGCRENHTEQGSSLLRFSFSLFSSGSTSMPSSDSGPLSPSSCPSCSSGLTQVM